MNILFLTTGRMDSIEQHAIYPDLLRCFRDNGHNVYTVSSYEKRLGKETELVEDHGAHMLHVKIGNLTKTNLLEKGVSTLRIEGQYLAAIKKYFSGVKFDLVMYSTPPITLVKVIEHIKKRDHCTSYLLLKDIFPQNAVDLGMMQKTGIKGLLYKYFRNKEKKLYKISDYIGCMSQANVDYVLKHNPVDPAIVEVCPNSVEVQDMSVDEKTRTEIRNKYNIPLERKVFVYGGNLGKPQGIDFLIKCLESQREEDTIYFLIVGDGTEFPKIDAYLKKNDLQNVKLMKRLPKEDYDKMVGACDVGMVFLDHRFTIPNFPSRLLSYMQAKIPVLVCTDPNTDIGNVVVDGGFGWKCGSEKINEFETCVKEALQADLKQKGNNAQKYLIDFYDVKQGYKIIMTHFNEVKG